MKKDILNNILLFLFSFFFIIGIVFIILGFNNYKIVDFNYNENNDIKYKVYLKKNNFFEKDYLDENRTYISNLIDYIDIYYNYNINYNFPVTGEYTYKIVAIVSANKIDSEDYYWKKEYDLTEEKKVKIIDSTNQLSINENTKVYYDKYNDILNSFKKEYSLASNGLLKIALVVNNKVVCEYMDEPLDISSNINLSIPLLQQTVDASISKDAKNSANKIEFKQKNKNIKYLLYRFVGFGLLIISLIHLFGTIISKLSYKRKHKYETTLNKILKTYDSIIANVCSKPDLTGFKIVFVSDFNELLDIYKEVRVPINFYQDTSRKISTFIIYKENIAWIYGLKKYKYVERGNSCAKEEITDKQE